jgi:hypothetical protein
MFVEYKNELHYVTKTVNLVTSSTESSNNNKKRKRNAEETELYILFNINEPQGEFAVPSNECKEKNFPLNSGIYHDFCTIVEREYCKRYNFDFESSVNYNDYFWRVSYKSEKTERTKNYDIYKIIKIMNDGFLCTLYSTEEIRHFKFKNLYNNCGDGLINKYFD